MKKNNQRSPLSIIGGIFFIVIISLLGFFTASHAMGPSMGNSSFPSLFSFSDSVFTFLIYLHSSSDYHPRVRPPDIWSFDRIRVLFLPNRQFYADEKS